MVSRPAIPERVGGALVLDFVNTRDAWLNEARRHEFLRDYDALVAWALAAGALAAPPGGGDDARRRAVHRRALALRDALFALLAPLAAGGAAGDHARPRAEAVAAVNAAWAELEARPVLDPATLVHGWSDAPDALLGSVLVSARDLLRDGPLDRLKQCPGPDGWCGWLFLDGTKNGSRRWCSMAVCGNPAKMRARAARRRGAR
jgi:predicted RNA-binding Zn ribbon-like protein